MSHFDKLVRLPEGFVVVASTTNSKFAGIAHQTKPIFGTLVFLGHLHGAAFLPTPFTSVATRLRLRPLLYPFPFNFHIVALRFPLLPNIPESQARS